MAGFYSGNFADAKIIHPLDTEDCDDIGPGAWTLGGTATIEATNARFGNNLRCDANGERLDSDVVVPGFDGSDGKKALFLLYWQTPNLSGVKTMGGIVNSAITINRTRIFFFSGRVHVDWTRESNLGGPSTTHLRILSNSGKIVVDTSHTLMGFIDSGSAAQGKIFIDGVDETFSITNSGIFGATVGNHQDARLGNHFNNLDPGQFVDHFVLVQDPTMDDNKVQALIDKRYDLLRGGGYRPKFVSLAAA